MLKEALVIIIRFYWKRYGRAALDVFSIGPALSCGKFGALLTVAFSFNHKESCEVLSEKDLGYFEPPQLVL